MLEFYTYAALAVALLSVVLWSVAIIPFRPMIVLVVIAAITVIGLQIYQWQTPSGPPAELIRAADRAEAQQRR